MHSIPSQEDGVELESTSSLQEQTWFVAGMASLFGCVSIVTSVLDREPIGLFFPVIALLTVALALFAEYALNTRFATLFADRIEEPTYGVILWKDVVKLRWSGEEMPQLRLFTEDSENSGGIYCLNLNDLSDADRLKFITYVSITASNLTQEMWPRFCQRVAVPLLKKVEESKERDEQTEPAQFIGLKRFWAAVLAFPSKYPFLTGLLFPVGFVLIPALCCSRRTSWTIAAMLAISGVVNIRVVWGEWIEPFTSIAFGSVAAFFFFGLFSMPRKTKPHGAPNTLNPFVALTYLATFLIGIPFAVNAMAKGWLAKGFNDPIKWLALGCIYFPLLMAMWCQRSTDKRTTEEKDAEALDYWNSRQNSVLSDSDMVGDAEKSSLNQIGTTKLGRKSHKKTNPGYLAD